MDQQDNAPAAPCIGMLVIDFSNSLTNRYGNQYQSYIPASYVKYLESAGALIVPIWIGRERFYYRYMMSKVNGIFIPGGGIPLSKDESGLGNDYLESAYHIYDLVLELNRAGKYFPLWSICMGFQLLLMHSAKSLEARTECAKVKNALPLVLAKDFWESKLFEQLPDRLANELDRIPFACHNHEFCISKENFDNFQLSKDWRILATLCDDLGLEFITLVEHRCYPIFGCQFHPERVAFDQLFLMDNPWKVANSPICIEMSQYMANTFVQLCRRNKNCFANAEQLSRHLIWNWQVMYTGKVKKLRWIQVYVFEENADYRKDEAAIDQCDCKK